jgi:hypothetical protein
MGPRQLRQGFKRERIKVFWLLASEKNEDSSFSEEKEAKRLLDTRSFTRRGMTSEPPGAISAA